MNPAVIPALFFTIVALIVFTTSLVVARRHRDDDDEHLGRLVLPVGVVYFAIGVNTFVAFLALIGVVKEQDTITFWAAMARSVAGILGLYLAWRWWHLR